MTFWHANSYYQFLNLFLFLKLINNIILVLGFKNLEHDSLVVEHLVRLPTDLGRRLCLVWVWFSCGLSFCLALTFMTCIIIGALHVEEKFVLIMCWNWIYALLHCYMHGFKCWVVWFILVPVSCGMSLVLFDAYRTLFFVFIEFCREGS